MIDYCYSRRAVSWAAILTTCLLLILQLTTTTSLCLPTNNTCWPPLSKWNILNTTINGSLSSPSQTWYKTATNMVYPNWQHIQGHTSSPLALPTYTVTATHNDEIVATVKFAYVHNIRLSIKSSGHSYTGRSTAANAILLALGEMKKMTFHKQFNDGCSPPPTPSSLTATTAAVTVQPGVDFAMLYPFLDKHGYVVTGGGGSTVGAAGGYVLGGGHSALSRSLGLATDNVLQFQLILPNSTTISVTKCQHSDLWWALRGGGGGSFGVVTNLTYQVYTNPTFLSLRASYPMEGNVTNWLHAIVQAQPYISNEWGCYYECLPGIGALSRFASWKISCLYYGNNQTHAKTAMAPIKEAFDLYPSTKSTFVYQFHSSFWDWKKGDNGGDTTGIASILTSRIFPPSAFGNVSNSSSSGGCNAKRLAYALLDGVRQGVNIQIASLLGGRQDTIPNSRILSYHTQYGCKGDKPPLATSVYCSTGTSTVGHVYRTFD